MSSWRNRTCFWKVVFYLKKKKSSAIQLARGLQQRVALLVFFLTSLVFHHHICQRIVYLGWFSILLPWFGKWYGSKGFFSSHSNFVIAMICVLSDSKVIVCWHIEAVLLTNSVSSHVRHHSSKILELQESTWRIVQVLCRKCQWIYPHCILLLKGLHIALFSIVTT